MAERPNLTADRWMRDDEPEFIRIRSQAVADLQRISRGIFTIARILHNSIGDDSDGQIRSSVGTLDKQNLAGAVESLSDFMYAILEDETFDLAEIERLQREAHHD